MKVKICGITRREDAAIAVRAGADALGFVFVRSSKRWIDPEKASAIIRSLPSHVTPVGVFVNATRDEIHAVVRTTGIRLLQLHGDETPEEASGLGLPVWKAFRVKPKFDTALLAAFHTDGFLLDTYVEGSYGGTGKTFNWEVALAAKKYGQIILSGGIAPDNVAAAIRVVTPYAIDVSSGVESSPGVKDAGKIARLFDAMDFCRRNVKKEPLC